MADSDIGRQGLDAPSVRDRMEQLWRAISQPHLGGFQREGVWHPVVDIYERDEAILVEVELPGMKGQDVHVSIDDNHLILEGSRAPSENFREGDLSYCERPLGKFHRIIHLSENVDAEGTSAGYEDGILTVTMPRKVREKGRKIEIT